MEEGRKMKLSIHIKKQLRSFLLQVDLDCEDGVFALLGPSGCGKSMTLKCIAGIETPDEGYIAINDVVVFDSKNHINVPIQKRHCGFMFQNYALFPNMTVKENIACAVQDKTIRKHKTEQIMKTYDLMELADVYPSHLSGGQAQRCAFARTMASNPQILLLDEPFSAMDKYIKKKLSYELQHLLETFSGCVIYVSHDNEEVYSLADQIALLNHGRIVEKGNKEKIFHHPETVYGAIQAGYENISEIEILDSYTFYAKDWDMVLKSDIALNTSYTHAAIRAEDICSQKQSENSYEIEVVKTISNLNGTYSFVRNKGTCAKWLLCKEECITKQKQIVFPKQCLCVLKSKKLSVD